MSMPLLCAVIAGTLSPPSVNGDICETLQTKQTPVSPSLTAPPGMDNAQSHSQPFPSSQF